MSKQFPKIVAAVRAAEGSESSGSWAIGDALLAEVGPPPGSGATDTQPALHEVIKVLEETGLDVEKFTVGYLGDLRRIAHAFPPKKRHAKFSFSVHQEARTPEVLEKILDFAGKGGHKVSKRLVRRVVVQQREKANRKWEAEQEKRRQRGEVVVMPPPRRRAVVEDDNEVEPPTKLDVMIADLEIMTKTGDAVRLGKEVLTQVTEHVEEFDLTDVTINAFVEGALEAANVWREVANAARRFKANKRGHLTAVS